MEGTTECPWWTTGAWHTLLGHLCPSSDMANGTLCLNSLHPPGMAKSPTGFRHGIPTSAHRDATLYAVAARIPMPWDDKKNTCLKTNTQCGQAETGWPHLEYVYGQGHERHCVYTKQI